jgi:subtilase family serine protease
VLDAIRRVCEGVEDAERTVKERHADGFAGRKAKTKTLAAVLGILVIGAGMWPAAAAGRSEPRTIVALRGRDDAGLDALVAAQQDPASPEYRRWTTGSEFGRRFGAAPRDLKRVERWLRDSGCRVKRPAAREQVTCVGGSPGAVPATLRPLVGDVLDPATPLELRFNLSRARFDPRSVASRGSFFLSPDEYAAFFGYSALRAAGIDGHGQRIGIVGAASVLNDDVTAFRDRFDLPPLDLEKVGDAGPATSSTDAQLEAILDVSWAGAVAPGAGIVLAVSGGSLVDAIGDLVAMPDVSVISLSVVLIPSPASAPFIRHARRLFRQAAARGKTVLIASGDFGPLVKLSPKLKRGVDPMTASPFVTTVGGTTPVVPNPSEVIEYGSEVVWQDGQAASGGGRARGPRPSWQHGRSPHRTVPDVSLPAADIYPIALNGQVGCCIGGTSAAAPAWAGLVAMLNQQRGGPVGLLNPALYALGREQARGGTAVFHDIVIGSNGTTLTRGFPAKPGYDLATGWGTPDVPALFAAFP